MGVIGIEEIFLKVKDMEKALDFYHGIVGLPIDKQDGERTYLQAERGHILETTGDALRARMAWL